MTKTNTLLAILLGSAAAVPMPAVAATAIVDTGTPTQTNGGLALIPAQTHAFQFSTSLAYNLTDVQAWIYGPSNTLNYVLYSNSAGLPGTVIRAFSYTTPGGVAAWVGPSVHFTLQPGTYWLALEPTTENNYGLAMPGGYFGGAPHPLVEAYTNSAQPTYAIYPFSGYGLRIYADAVQSGVPEPSAWAMMIAGVGILGAVRRTRRKRVTIQSA